MIEEPSGALGIDLGDYGISGPIQFIRLRSLSNAGSIPGFDLVGFEAINIAPPRAGAYEVVITATETVEGIDFGQLFRDDPPQVFLEVTAEPGGGIRAGQSATVQISATDDVGVAGVSLTVNGQVRALDAELTAEFIPAFPGLAVFEAEATDTGGQSTTRRWELYVLHSDGTLPFDPTALGPEAAADGGVTVRIAAPAAGAVIEGDSQVIGLVSGPAPLDWTLEYALVDAIDPYALAAVDPDYVELGSGAGFLHSEPMGVFPGSSLADGIYFLRASGRPSGGGPTVYTGQVIAKGVDESALRPVVLLDDPSDGAVVSMVQEIRGSILSDRLLREWYAEYAPAASVDPNHLGGNDAGWVRFASGDTPVEDGVIAEFDATRVPNGSYILRVAAWNDIGMGRVEALALEVAGEAKLGRLRREFTDLRIELAGFPLELRRIYDSFDAGRSGDFGFGWSLALADADIRETVPDTGSNLFGATPFRVGTRVYVTSPHGGRAGFTFRAELAGASFLGAVYRAVFDPDPGVYERLEIPEGDQGFLTVDASGAARLFLLGFPWNPDRYVLVTPDQRRYVYHEDDGLLEAEDPAGQRLVVSSDAIRHSSGLELLFGRDPAGRIIAVTGPEGRTWRYDYDAAGDLAEVTDPDGLVTRHTYHETPPHYLREVIDPLGRIGTAYEYDADGRLVAVIDERGNRVETMWEPGSFSGSVTDRRGNVTQLTYDVRGNILRSEDPLGGITLYEYGDPENPDLATRETDALGNVTRNTYDNRGNLIRQQPPLTLGGEFTAAYDEDGRVLRRSEYRNFEWNFSYDERGNIVEWVPPFGQSASFQYSAEGRMVQSTNEAGFDTWLDYDLTTGFPKRVRDANGFDFGLTYDRTGNLTSATGPRGETWMFQFNAAGLPLRQTDPLGRTREVARQPDGDFLATNRLGAQTRYRLASDELLEQITFPGGGVLTPGYDPERNLASLTDPLGNAFLCTYDALDRLIRVTDPAGASESFAYDAVGNVVESVDRNGKRRTFAYDANRQRTAERWHDNAGEIVREIVFTWVNGSLRTVADGEATWTVGGVLPRPVSWSVTYPGQTTFIIAYNWSSRETMPGPAQVTVRVSPFSPTVDLRAAYHGKHAQFYSWEHPEAEAGHVQLRRQADGMVTDMQRFDRKLPQLGDAPFSRTEIDFDLTNRAEAIRHLGGDALPVHPSAALAFTRDAEGQISRIEQGADAVDYTYDAAGQLLTAAHSAYPDESYAYDLAGNRTGSHRWASAAEVETGNRITSAGEWAFTYDAAGNVARRVNTGTGEITDFEYDHRNRLHRAAVRPAEGAAPSSVCEFDYDFLDRMIRRTIDGETAWVLHDRLTPVAEFRDGSASLSASFFYALDRAGDLQGVWREGEGTRWFLKDQVGSVRGVLDDEGALLGWLDYDAFGNPQGEAPEGFGAIRHAGRTWLPQLGLYENGRRFYDPAAGRFLQEDPIRFAGGDFNLYRYANNNPLSYYDPQGTLAAIEYASLVAALARPAQFCAFAACVAELWEGVTNAVVNLAPAQPAPNNCGLQLLPGGGLVEDLQNELEGKGGIPLGKVGLAIDIGTELVDRGPGGGLAGPGVELFKLSKCLYDAQQ